ncbi:MAG: hypothetical protein PVI21_02700 [Candidatus Woesebacteria bacterium]|jgi:hypothetical protein
MASLTKTLCKLSLAITASLVIIAQPASAAISDYLDFTQNNIQTYDPRDSLTICGTTEGVEGFSPDPAAVEYFNENYKAKYERLIPLYQKASAAEDVADWQLIAAIHALETSLSTTNPTSNPNYRGIFQQNEGSLRSNGIDPYAAPYDSGRQLTDDEIVTQARSAIKIFIKGKAKASTVNVDTSKSLSVNDAMKLFIAYKSGQGSPWLTGGGDPNLHAYTWAGYDTTPEHKLPMAWGSTNDPTPPGDEKPGKTQNRPGALTIWVMLKSGDVGSIASANCVGASGTYQEITGSREELVSRILGNSKLKLGNFGNAATQKTDIQNELTMNTLVVLVASLEQSGVSSLPINALKSDHRDNGGDHPAGRAADFGFYANGEPCISQGNSSICGTAEGNKLYSFLYTNYQQLKIDQLIWNLPQSSAKCIGGSKPVDCAAFYGGDLYIHWHHIHVGVES